MERDIKFQRIQDLQSQIEKLKTDLNRGKVHYLGVRYRYNVVRHVVERANLTYQIRELAIREVLLDTVFWHERLRMLFYINIVESVEACVKAKKEYLRSAENFLQAAMKRLEKAESFRNEAEAALTLKFAEHNVNVAHIVQKIMLRSNKLVAEHRLECVHRQTVVKNATARLRQSRQKLALCIEVERKSKEHRVRRVREQSLHRQMLKSWREARLLAARNVKRIKTEIMRIEMEVQSLTLQ